MTQQEIVLFWTSKAEDELKAAKVMFNSGNYLYTGFMCHQCIEKALKAYYIFINDERQPYLHNLEKLVEITGLIGLLDEVGIDSLKKLNPLYIETRYEDYKNDIADLLTQSYCQLLLTETEALFLWISSLIRQSGNTQDK